MFYLITVCSVQSPAIGTYDNEETVKKMVVSQGYRIEAGKLKYRKAHRSGVLNTELVPRCPKCGRLMSMNLRADNTFVQDAGWDLPRSVMKVHKIKRTKRRISGVGTT